MTVSATKVQEKVASIGAGTTTFAATFDTACTAGNLIIWIAASDGNAGTTTQPTDTPNLPIALKSNDVSLHLAWGVADGGETAISGTVSSNVAGGRCWIIELADPGTGSWARRYTSTVFTASAGATSADATIPTATAAAEGGYGIACATWDAVATAGTAAWSNSWATDFDGSSGTAVSLWTATKAAIAHGTQESTTLTRTGGTAEQYQALLVVFGKIEAGAMAGSAPQATGALAATAITPATGPLAGSTPHPTGTLAASITDPGVLVGQTSHPVGAMTGSVGTAGTLAGSAPHPTGTLAAGIKVPGVLAGSAPHPYGDLFGGTDSGVFAGAAPVPVGRLRTVPRPFAAGGGDGPVAELLDDGPVAAGGADPIAEHGPGPAATTVVLTP